jgi:hypothetical protein
MVVIDDDHETGQARKEDTTLLATITVESGVRG